MSYELFIANRFLRADAVGGNGSRPAVRIAIAGIALGLAVMIIAIAVIVGFKREVRNQVVGFGGHIQVFPSEDYGIERISPSSVMRLSDETFSLLCDIDGITSVQRIATQPGIINTPAAFQGILLKGVDDTFDWDFFRSGLMDGTTLDFLPDTVRNGAVVSKAIADAMDLVVGDDFVVYFVNNNLRVRKFTVAGVYKTTFSDYDKLFIITDLEVIRSLNGWHNGEYTSLELLVDDYGKLDITASGLFMELMSVSDGGRMNYRVETIETMMPQMFDWLGMLDMNAAVILVLMLAVSGFCVISGLLILILERRQTIGLLKALGADNRSIRKIFLSQAGYLISKGLLWGNIIGLIIIALQFWFHIIPLDPEAYYVDSVPVFLTFGAWFGLNLGLGIAAFLMLIAPSYLVTKISPVEAMRFD